MSSVPSLPGDTAKTSVATGCSAPSLARHERPGANGAVAVAEIVQSGDSDKVVGQPDAQRQVAEVFIMPCHRVLLSKITATMPARCVDDTMAGCSGKTPHNFFSPTFGDVRPDRRTTDRSGLARGGNRRTRTDQGSCPPGSSLDNRLRTRAHDYNGLGSIQVPANGLMDTSTRSRCSSRAPRSHSDPPPPGSLHRCQAQRRSTETRQAPVRKSCEEGTGGKGCDRKSSA